MCLNSILGNINLCTEGRYPVFYHSLLFCIYFSFHQNCLVHLYFFNTQNKYLILIDVLPCHPDLRQMGLTKDPLVVCKFQLYIGNRNGNYPNE